MSAYLHKFNSYLSFTHIGKMKKIITLLSFAALSFCPTISNGQSHRGSKAASFGRTNITNSTERTLNQWQRVPEGMAPSQSIQRIKPERFLVYRLNDAAMRLQLFSLSTDPEEGAIMSLPMPDGSFRDFKVWETPMMNGRLANRYPDIKTFTAEAVNDRRVTAKLDFTLFGFHAMIFESGNTSFIDPFDSYHDGYYIVHYKRDEHRTYAERMKCEVKAPEETVAGHVPFTVPGKLPSMTRVPGGHPAPAAYAAARTANGWTMRTYEIALSANSYYCQAATGLPSPTIGQALSAMTTTMNRVNGVYNRELSVQMNFTSLEDTLIWPTATGSINGADPFASINSNPSSCLTTNQTVCDTRITGSGVAYDIGHVFTTGAGGLAQLQVVCNSTQKAKGVTGSPSPVGDGYDIDYVAHEVGHEFGSNHTFNNNQDGSCSGNAVSTCAYEPGSGATIMDYAGICTPDDLQLHSDPYFNSSSLQQITNGLATTETSCAVTASSGHDTGHLVAFTASYNIPYKTPFELTGPTATGTGTDTAVTYQWFQWNLGQTGAGGDFGNRMNQASFRAPIFRSFQPVYTPYRCFPKTSMVLAGVLSDAGTDNNEGEKAADTARFLTMKMALRNILAGKGCVNIPDDTIHINVSSTGSANGYAGFKVTSQGTTGITYAGGSSQTVTWNVVGTNAAPVSASNVDIYMSVDGGYTWPYTVGTFPNTGSASVTIPNPAVSSATARIKVKGSGNIFFNINSNNFTVNAVAATAPITGTFTVCAGFTTTLADATPGGTWASSTPSVATVNASGVVTGVSAGTSTITYTASGGPVIAVVTVSAIPSVGAITGTASVCIGQTVTLSNPTTGGVWSSTDPAVATINSSGVVSGLTAGTTTISYVVTNGCGTGGATRVVTVSAPTAVAPIAGSTSVCTGSTITLSDATPLGTWSSSNAAVASVSSTGVVSGMTAGTTTISYSVTNGSGCVSSATVIVTVNATPSASIVPSGTVTICTGGWATLTASTGTGYSYQWQIGGGPISGATNSSYNASGAGVYNVVINTTAGCSATSSGVTIVVSAGVVVVPSVNITTSTSTVFCGSAPTVTFTANPVNGGSAPAYQWFVNGIPAGTGGATYAYVPVNGDNITVQMTSNAPCAMPTIVNSSAVTVTVTPMVTPTVIISASPNDTVCAGSPVTYTAVTTYGGTAPTFLWQEDGISVATGPTYTASTPHDGDVIVCTMTSNYSCVSTTTATSAPFVMHVLAPVANTVTVTASSTEVAAGTAVTFIAASPYAVAYQWFINGTPVPGATTSVFTTTTLNNGEIVTCAAISGYMCALPNVVISGGITMHVAAAGIKNMTFGDFNILPNPNKGTFLVRGETTGTADGSLAVSLINMLGQTVYKGSLAVKNNKVNEQIVLDESLANGMYLIKLTAESDYVVFHILLER